MSLTLCIVAFFLTLYLSRKSLVGGIASAIAFGYFYGILRANLNEMMSHFIFDAALIGLYIGRIFAVRNPDVLINTKRVQPWLIVLIAWPVFMTLLPIQDPLIQLVGLRGSMIFLPMVLLGAQMESEQRDRLALSIAILNIVAFGFALAEFWYGLQDFYPRNEMTESIYRSRTDEISLSFRIPATFTGSAAYAGAMVATLPFLIGSWASRTYKGVRQLVLVSGLVVAVVGVFMAASRTHALVLFFLIIIGTLSFQMRPAMMGMWISIILVVGWFVFQDARLQRFRSLQDTEYVAARFSGSVNASFLTAITDYPMGNGIGGGGTSIPYFLADRVSNPVVIENEYARMQLELGLPGLILWLSFVAWVLRSGLRQVWFGRNLAQRLAFALVVAYSVTALTGTGLLTAIPQTLLLMFSFGWVVRDESRGTVSSTTELDPMRPETIQEFGAVPR